MHREGYEELAALLSYPEEQRGQADGLHLSTAVADHLAQFEEMTTTLSPHELQELFIQTFDLNPVCSLEMGWHLFGENYDRGLLLVKMRQQLRLHGIPETSELSDHLTNALRLLACMEPAEAEYFADAIVLPALEKMFDAIHGKNNPYEHVLEAVRLAVRENFPELPARVATPATESELRVLA